MMRIIEEIQLGNRLSKIYTRTGDDGTTGLGDGTRIAKNSLRVHALGDVDELNAALGVLLTEPLQANIHAALEAVQHNLFNIGGELCMPGYALVKPEHVTALENQLDAWNDELKPLKEFILPGGSRAAAYCHLARTVCRRAERTMYALNEQEPLNSAVLQYINRLSDLLFVLCRVLNKNVGVNDVLWQQES